LIDSLAEMQVYEQDAEVWYINGLVYETIYFSKDSATRQLTKSPLLMAAESYVKVSQSSQNAKYSKLASKRLDSAVTKSLFQEGVKLEKEKKIEDAVSHFSIYNKIKTDDTSGLIKLAIAAEKAQKYELAKESYGKLINLNYKTKSIYKSLIVILKEANTYDEVKRILVEAQNLYPNDEDWTKLDISLAFAMQKNSLALLKLDSAAAKFPQNKKLYYFNKAAYYDSKDSTNLAIANYEKSLDEDANYFDSNFNLGGIYYRKSKSIYTKINEMPYPEYQSKGRETAVEGHIFSKLALPYFERCYQIRKEETVKALLWDIYKNLKLNSRLRALEKNRNIAPL